VTAAPITDNAEAGAIAFSSQHSALSIRPFGVFFSVPPLEITMKNFRDLMVWQKAHALTLASY
jgi:hypothetical protein